MPLNAEHATHLAASGLSEAVIAARGYTTITEYQQLRDLGFSEAQAQRIPALGIPCWNQRGEPYGWQIRPDHPRATLDGKVIKYETPRGNRVHLDVHPSQHEAVGNPGVRLWITEGIKKGDALASQGECCLALQGVWGWRGSNKEGGKTALPGWHDVALNDRQVYLVFDNDVTRNSKVRSALEALHNYLTGRGAQPHIVLLPASERKIGIDDYLVEGHTITDVLALADQPLPKPENSPQLKPGLPLLTLHPHELPALVEQSFLALAAMPQAPRLFQRTRRLVVVAPAEPHAQGMQRGAGAPMIHPVSAPMLRHLLSQAANWQSPGRSPGRFLPDKPPTWLVDTLLDAEQWPAASIPPLTGIMGTPTLRPDGSILDHPGYDAHTGLYLHWEATTWPPIPEQPSRDEARAACALLAEPFAEYPFAQLHHRTALLAAILSVLGRYLVGTVPAFPIRSTVRGSGKTMLADCISLIGLGKMASKFPETKDEDEERKRLFSVALDGDPLVCIDNLRNEFGSPALDQALTSGSIKDRLLGKNQNREATLNAIFLATGNNLGFRGDLARRVVPIDLEPNVENPEERTGFAHPDLRAYILRMRPYLVVAGLTILRAYWVAGRPEQPIPPYGSFESWSDTIRSALVWAGEPDPCLGRVGLEASSDEGYDAHAELLRAWEECYTRPATLRTIMQDVALYIDDARFQRLRDALGAYDQRYDGTKLNLRSVGKALKKLTRIIEKRRLRSRQASATNSIEWYIESLSNP